ncbi:dnaJ homolog subfamily C member 27-A-like isoform X3 [Biomphalaria glabrata]|nr:dnaJ homolog subfamily C member 27-A-like isoform X3 [Biomphalaria glabrata]XP_055869324.1 dnaJ homolog subfamily C member 27-A-like isoform X3 [Biomphalaria glabrata]XP_055869325.1 dnaJ homolog subfamily C member 27-A-like isoform X3 [Biomphalaria glabrata]XP_055869326.1 dnaJ homolog subfamily C member 27-A-like isoform X3 [Biomphalaria glabrata]XP_055869327.1 dnaJ homolog subfamily C member 27-A-like isoform X3 [Biomphalaria glabrata]XP_055869328.1 dnaJ homolog subfamily C member 27-A-lik
MERTVGTLTIPYENAVANLNWIKIIGVGSCNVGKTSLIKHFCESKFTSNYQPTVGVDYGFKVENINGCDVRVNIWDFSGSTDYLEVRNELYSKTNGIFLVFDVTNATTFDSLDQWLREITQYSSNSAQIFIVGNKEDKVKFYEGLKDAIANIPQKEHMVILGDLNARLGSDHAILPSAFWNRQDVCVSYYFMNLWYRQ